MLPPAHLLSGYLVLFGLTRTADVAPTATVRLLAGVFALLPDVDMLWSDSIQGHHDSLLHTPVCWLAVTVALLLLPVPQSIAILVGTETLFHLFSDYVAGRTTGVMLLYPLDRADYSLFPVDAAQGELAVRDGFSAVTNYLQFYLENRAVVGFEAGVMITGAIAVTLLV
jgi:hypothetical protein